MAHMAFEMTEQVRRGSLKTPSRGWPRWHPRADRSAAGLVHVDRFQLDDLQPAGGRPNIRTLCA